MRAEKIQFPLRRLQGGEIQWVTPTYHQVHSVLTNPVYAGAYAFGKTRRERYVDEHGRPRKRTRKLPREEWEVLIWDHHPGYIDSATFEANQAQLASNTRPRAHEPGGAVREGAGAASGDRRVRPLRAQAQGALPGQARSQEPRLSLPRQRYGRGPRASGACASAAGGSTRRSPARCSTALTPAGVKAALRAAEALEQDHDAALAQWRLQVERARYEAERAERRYRQVEPEHRLVARGLERDWEKALGALAEAEAELASCASASARARSPTRSASSCSRSALTSGGCGRRRPPPTATASSSLRCLIEEVILDVDRQERRATLTMRWHGGALTELAVPLPKPQPAIRTDEDTIALLERLAAHYDDATIAAILNRQGRRSATGERFTQIIVGGLRRYRNIPAYKPPAEPPDGELLPVGKAAEELGVAPSTLLRWLQAGFIAGEQDTPGAPWRIRVNDELRALFVEDAPAGYVPIVDAMRILGVSRQTVLQRVKRGELQAIHVRSGRRKGLRIQVPQPDSPL